MPEHVLPHFLEIGTVRRQGFDGGTAIGFRRISVQAHCEGRRARDGWHHAGRGSRHGRLPR